jgi:hypothetical protein
MDRGAAHRRAAGWAAMGLRRQRQARAEPGRDGAAADQGCPGRARLRDMTLEDISASHTGNGTADLATIRAVVKRH